MRQEMANNNNKPIQVEVEIIKKPDPVIGIVLLANI
jgi:hypothetical protein